MPTKTTSKRTTEDLTKQKHYTDLAIEPVEVIPAWVDDYPSYLKGSVLSYLGRHKITKEIRDLKKARVFLDWLIEEVE